MNDDGLNSHNGHNSVFLVVLVPFDQCSQTVSSVEPLR